MVLREGPAREEVELEAGAFPEAGGIFSLGLRIPPLELDVFG